MMDELVYVTGNDPHLSYRGIMIVVRTAKYMRQVPFSVMPAYFSRYMTIGPTKYSPLERCMANDSTRSTRGASFVHSAVPTGTMSKKRRAPSPSYAMVTMKTLYPS